MLASRNAGKLAEFRTLLAAQRVTLLSLRELGIDSPPETGLSFVENALLKARHAAAESGLPAIADDSGLCVHALDGAPGLRSARYAGADASDARNVARVLQQLHGVPPQRRQAHFVCVIAVLQAATDPDPIIATGRWQGYIAPAPRGSGGFGYDPIFEIPALGKTAAELSPTQKSQLSHRAQATRMLLRIRSAERAAAAAGHAP